MSNKIHGKYVINIFVEHSQPFYSKIQSIFHVVSSKLSTQRHRNPGSLIRDLVHPHILTVGVLKWGSSIEILVVGL